MPGRRRFAEPFLAPLDTGAGWQEVVKIANPAAGQGLTYKVAGEYITRPKVIIATLAPSGAGSPRALLVQYENPDAGIVAVSAANIAQAAATTVTYCFGLGYAPNSGQIAQAFTGGLPDVYLEPGYVVRLRIINVAGTDQLSGVFFVLERMPTKRGGPLRRG